MIPWVAISGLPTSLVEHDGKPLHASGALGRSKHLGRRSGGSNSCNALLEFFPGWKDDISGARTFEDLPRAAQDYVLALERMSGTRISVIGVGASRDAVIVRHGLVD